MQKNIHLLAEGKYPVYLFKTDTSGEKLYEEIYRDQEKCFIGRFKALGVISKNASYDILQFTDIIKELRDLLTKENTAESDIAIWLKRYIPEFSHIETGLSLDKKMEECLCNSKVF